MRKKLAGWVIVAYMRVTEGLRRVVHDNEKAHSYMITNGEILASRGLPVRRGGAREFFEDDCGFVVPSLDFEMMGGRITELAHSRDTRVRMGRRAAQKVPGAGRDHRREGLAVVGEPRAWMRPRRYD